MRMTVYMPLVYYGNSIECPPCGLGARRATVEESSYARPLKERSSHLEKLHCLVEIYLRVEAG